MKRIIKVILGCVIGSMTLVSCGKDEPVDIDNLDYSFAYGASISAYYEGFVIPEDQKSLFDIIFTTFENKLNSIPGHTTVDKYKFRIAQTTLYPAAEIVKKACYDAEAQLATISSLMGDIEDQLEIQLTMTVTYQACDKSVDFVYSKTFGHKVPPVDGI